MRVAKLLLLCLISAVTSEAHGMTWLWAWDRPEDLRGLPSAIGVAYFAVQFDADGQTFAPTWRRPPLRVDATTPLTAVFHIEAFRPGHAPMLDDVAAGRWSDAMASAAHRIGARRVQIDFEARASQLDFYRRVLAGLRARLAPGSFLSVTALASWCGDPAGVAALPVDEVVPMYFRMGAREREVWRERSQRSVRLPHACRQAAGLSIDESRSAVAPTVYLFAPRPWRSTDFKDLDMKGETR